jgi:hypothetical protein
MKSSEFIFCGDLRLPSMHDKWSKKLPDGRTVIYTSEFLAEDGGVISAEVDETVLTRSVPTQMTREEVEARFATLPNHPSTHRHSRRLYIHVRVNLHWRLENQRLISEETETVVVNAHGALVRLEAVPILSQKVTLENISTRATQDAIVVFLGKPAAKGGTISVGVEFTKPNAPFWHVSFPPEDWSLAHPDAKA